MHVRILVEHRQETVPEAVEEWLDRLLESDYAPETCYVGPDGLEIHDEETRQYPGDPHIPTPSPEVLAWLSQQDALIEEEGRGRFLWVVR